MRYPEIDASRTTKWIHRLRKDDNALLWLGAPVTVILGISFVLPLVVIESLWFLLLLIPVLFVVAGGIRYLTETFSSEAISKDENLDKAEIAYSKIRGYETTLARPLMLNIHNHAKEGHPGEDYYSRALGKRCSTCGPRLDALDKLVPKRVDSDDDIKAVDDHMKLMKELMQ